jgi:DNA-binding CsgD family transcriptional regulator
MLREGTGVMSALLTDDIAPTESAPEPGFVTLADVRLLDAVRFEDEGAHFIRALECDVWGEGDTLDEAVHDFVMHALDFTQHLAALIEAGEATDAETKVHALLSSRFAAIVIHSVNTSSSRFLPANRVHVAHPSSRLSRRELQAIRLLAAGRTPKEAAYRMGVAAKTLEGLLRTARYRLGVQTNEQAVRVAAARGLVELPVEDRVRREGTQ